MEGRQGMALGNTLFEGTWEEAMRRPDAIPRKAHIRIVEVEESPAETGEKTLAERFEGRLGLLSFEPADGSERLEKNNELV